MAAAALQEHQLPWAGGMSVWGLHTKGSTAACLQPQPCCSSQPWPLPGGQDLQALKPASSASRLLPSSLKPLLLITQGGPKTSKSLQGLVLQFFPLGLPSQLSYKSLCCQRLNLHHLPQTEHHKMHLSFFGRDFSAGAGGSL